MTITAANDTFLRFRARTQAEVIAALPEHLERRGWNRERVEAAQRDGLSRLLAHALARSPFHRRRLGRLDVDRFEVADLARLPVMTKSDMMSSLDDVFTDRRLCRDLVEAALASTGAEPVPIFGEYMALASGGSSGQRGVFVFDRAALSGFICALSRSLVARLQAGGGPPPNGLLIAFVAAGSAVHATGAAPALVAGSDLPFRFQPVPVTLPLPEIVQRLNALQAPALYGYPSMLVRLAAERRAGRLLIEPRVVTSTSETLSAEAREAITEAFGVPVVDTFGSTEGLVGTAAPGDATFVFNTDMCIVELVDEENRPVPPGVASAKALLTNLYNLAQPLIRYELTDSFVQLPGTGAHGHLCAQVQGRADDVFRYGSVELHPLVIRSMMVKTRDALDYQVRQTRRGIDIDVIGDVDSEGLRHRLVDALLQAGLTEPDVRVQVVANLERHRETGKLRQFMPLAS